MVHNNDGTPMSFEDWMMEVDGWLHGCVERTSKDFPDIDYREMFEREPVMKGAEVIDSILTDEVMDKFRKEAKEKYG
jgi:hypothetical protein